MIPRIKSLVPVEPSDILYHPTLGYKIRSMSFPPPPPLLFQTLDAGFRPIGTEFTCTLEQKESEQF